MNFFKEVLLGLITSVMAIFMYSYSLKQEGLDIKNISKQLSECNEVYTTCLVIVKGE